MQYKAYFLSLGDYKATEQQTRQQIQQDASHISLVLSIDCIYRYLLYEKEGYFSTYAKDMASLGPHLGIVGGGEQYNNQHVNKTMVCVTGIGGTFYVFALMFGIAKGVAGRGFQPNPRL